MSTLLEIDGLSIRYPGCVAAVDEVSLAIEKGEALGLVGESGSGKTQTALATMGLLPANAAVSGSIRYDGEELIGAPISKLNAIRACRIAMVFQDPRLALNPYVRIGKQLARILIAHRMCGRAEARRRTLDMLEKVGLPDPDRQYRAFPHQLSGGMRQRAMIGAALLGEPELLIADEPTTALDVTVQAQILSLLRSLREETGCALLFITHDLGVVAGNCERVVVMDQGKLVEDGDTQEIFREPRQQQTRALLDSAPRVDSGVLVAQVAGDAEKVLQLDDIEVSFRESRMGWGEALNAVRPVTLSVREGETVAIVGESGSGKTSLVRAALGLTRPDAGRTVFLGEKLSHDVARRPLAVRRNLQMVFQDPLASLNPTMSVIELIAEPLRIHEPGKKAADRRADTFAMLDRVGLDAELASRRPHELSGGQAQRVAIARALILRPKLLVCDEAVAALDGTVQHEVLTLLRSEQVRSGLSIIFITHDLAVVRQVSHRVLVMYMGRQCEVADNESLFRRPRHPYSKALLSAIPVPDPAVRPIDEPLTGEVASLARPPEGCPFHPRCRHAVAVCSEELPKPEKTDGGAVACHRATELDLSY